MLETEDAVQVKVDLPGHDPESIKVKLDGDTLTIQSERKQEEKHEGKGYRRIERSYGSYARSFVLGRGLDASATQARYENGVLTVTVPKKEEAKPKSIEVKVQK